MKQSLLWKLSRKGRADSFLLGTMHVKDKSVFGRIDQIETLIGEVDLFAAEYDLDEVRFVQQPNDLLIPDGFSIRDILGDKKFKRIQKIIAKFFDVDISQFEFYLPLLLVNVIAESILTKDYNLPLDLYLWNIAKKLQIKRCGIETYESQQKIMQAIKLKDQLKMLKMIAKNPSKYRKSVLSMAKLYEEEKIIALYKSGKKSLGKYKRMLLDHRNHIMARRFEEISEHQSIFVVVGAGHLSGHSGILRLLKEKGWQLKAI